MPTKLNSEFNYRYQVDGNTPWEKIKTLKGFLEGRVRAAALEQVAELKYQAKLEEIEHLKTSGAAKHLVLVAQAELIEVDSFRVTEKEAYELNRQEIAILEKLLGELYVIAEPTRIPGYTDEQMFEVNAANEFTVWVAREIHAELLATGHPSPAKLRNAMLYPGAFEALQKIGLIPAEANILVGGIDPLKIELDAVPPQFLTSQNVLSQPRPHLIASKQTMDDPVVELFSTPLYTANYAGDISSIKKYVESVKYNENGSVLTVQSENSFILQEEALADIKSFIEEQLEHYCKNILISENPVLITQSWLNKAVKGKSHHYHTHPNSVISGVFYINFSKDTPPIEFFRPQTAQILLSTKTPNNFSAQSFKPRIQAGDLILFPSSLPHSVPENQSDTTRYSLSFNTFISNPIGDKQSLTYLDPQMR
jgi:uncharacterized protein (TIGR02466 family)